MNALTAATATSTTLSTATLSTASSASGAPTPGSALESANAANESAEMPEHKDPLTTGQIAGIAVAGVIGLAFICALIFLCARRKNNDLHEIYISDPLPGSGPHYAAEPQMVESKYAPPRFLENTFPSPRTPQQQPSPTSSGIKGVRGSYDSELDREARRYEDMTPSAQPRLMI